MPRIEMEPEAATAIVQVLLLHKLWCRIHADHSCEELNVQQPLLQPDVAETPAVSREHAAESVPKQKRQAAKDALDVRKETKCTFKINVFSE
jgi:hypothetical protein